jgi:hypothetical protein
MMFLSKGPIWGLIMLENSFDIIIFLTVIGRLIAEVHVAYSKLCNLWQNCFLQIIRLDLTTFLICTFHQQHAHEKFVVLNLMDNFNS